MDIETANKLIRNIVTINNRNTGENIRLDTLKLVLHSSLYSNTKIPILKLELNGKILPKTTIYDATYKCITCEIESKVDLGNITRKIRENKIRCYKCKEYDPSKQALQSQFMSQSYQQHGKVAPKLRLQIILKGELGIHTSNIKFNEMPQDFKEKYFMKHLTEQEFAFLRKRIISIRDCDLNISDLIYCPHIIIHNQTKFNPYLYDPVTDGFIKPRYISYKCDNCNELFTNRDLYIQKSRTKLLCTNCNLCNNVFKVRPTTNIKGNRIVYQSKMELDFINFCADNNIVVENGPKLEYIWENGIHKYKVDFYLPSINSLVEIKAEHCWHKEQVANGK